MSVADAKSEPTYRIEHRLTGAVLLVATAVVLIPQLLKQPDPRVALVTHETAESGNLKTFKSKIEPINSVSVIKDEQGGSKNSASAKIESVASQSVEKVIHKPIVLTKNVQGESVSQPEANANDGALLAKPALKTTKATQTPQSLPPKSRDSDTKQAGSSETSNPERVVKAKARVEPKAEPKAELPPVKKATTSVKKPEKPSSAKSDTSSAAGFWVVRVGTFSKRTNVEAVTKLLNANSLKARTTRVQTSFGDATRIWLGPYVSKQAAQEISGKLKAVTGEKGYITKHTP